MLKSMNFKNDSSDAQSQKLTEALRLLDMVVHQCYCNNKRKSDDSHCRAFCLNPVIK